MHQKYNFLISLICFGIFIFEMICFKDILKHPYMIALIIIVNIIGGFHLGLGVGKILKNINKIN
jgi:hypothetical protein